MKTLYPESKLNRMKDRNKIVLGIDLGGTNTKIGLVDALGKVIERTSFPTGAHKPFEGFLRQLGIQARKLLINAGRQYQLVSVGIGAPNANETNGSMEHPPNFSWGDFVPMVEKVREIFRVPVYVTNDANAAALGELEFGIAKGLKNFVVLTLGTGLGGGIIVDGGLLRGAHGVAGELGHVSVKPNGRKCGCGLKGCLETYASVTGVKRTVFKFLAEMKVDSPLRRITYDDMTGEMIAEAALQKDPVALRAFEYTGNILGEKLADIAAFLDPQAIILSGGLTKAGEILLKPTLKGMEENLFVAYRGKIQLHLSHNSTGDGLLGAAALAWRKHRTAERKHLKPIFTIY